MANTKKIAFAVPESFQLEMRERIVRDGYGLRGKSKWVSEAIDYLLDTNNFPELVNLSDEMSGCNKVDVIAISPQQNQRIDQAIIDVRKEYPALEGVKSRIVRTAVLQRLLRRIQVT